MGRLAIAAILLTALAALATSPCYGFCMPPFGWHAKSLVERIELGEADLVVLAYVDATSPESGRHPYTADLEVGCIFKDTSGAGANLPEFLKDVRGFGGTWDCAETKVSAGKQYIIFLNLEGDRVVVAEVNGQEGAELAIPSRLQKVQKKYSCI